MTNNLNIASGALTLNGNTVDVANDVDVYGTLNMTNAADILNVGDAAYDNLAFYSGSFGNLTAGVVNLSSWVYIPSGGLLTATTGNTMNFNGPSIAGIDIRESGSVFGNINIISVSPFRFYSIGGHTIEIDGDFDLQAGNTMELMNNTVVVHGNFTDAATSIIYVYDGPVDGGNRNLFSANGNVENQNDISIIENPKNSQDSRSRGGSFEIDTDFTLTGLMDVSDGDVLVHGEFELATTGTLTIDGGSFISDEYTRDRAWRYLRGTFNLSDGLFEITNNSTNFASTAATDISGGTIRTGGAFYGVHTGTFQPTGGIVEIIGDAGDNAVYCSNGNYFYDLVINRNPGIYTALMQETHVQNDLTINSGILRSYNDLYVGGNWTNNVGPGGFLPYTHTVIFNGTNDVSITPGETFYNLILDKVSSADWLNIYGDLTIGNDLTINPGALYSGDNTISVSGNVAVNSGGVLYMEANSTLELGDASSLNVHSGGWLYTVGSSGNYATVTHVSTGSYSFSIWGSIGAQYAIFEYMSADGVNVKTTGYVHSTFTFNNCTFRNGISGGTLLTINNNLALTIDNATFPTNTWSGTYNVSKTEDQGSLTFTNATGDFAGPNYENDTFNRIDWDGFAPDLTITNVNWTDTNPYVCDMITVSVTIYNNGNVDIPGATGFYLDLYYNLSSPPASFETGDQSEYIISGIPAGDFIIVDFDVVYDVAESWSSYVQVDTPMFRLILMKIL
jgi:predicted outer membrane repeat protein